MEKIREIRLKALDVLGKQAADIDTALNQCATETSDLNAEAKLYFIESLGRRLAETAKRYHAEMHAENSKGEPHFCDHSPIDKSVFDFIFGKGLL